MMRRLTSFMTAFMFAFVLVVGLTACGKRGELRLPDKRSQSAPLWEQTHG